MHEKKKIVLLLSHSTQRDSAAHVELFKIVVKIISNGEEIAIDITFRNAVEWVIDMVVQKKCIKHKLYSFHILVQINWNMKAFK